jgi:chromosome segregation ATPase
MATKERKDDGGVVGRLAGKGEEALTRVMEGLGKNPRVTEALDRALSAKGKLDERSRSALNQIGLAAGEEIRDLRSQLERLERRLSELEGEKGTKTTAKRSTTKKASSAKRTTKPASGSAKEKAGQTTSPSAGRSIGGGSARGGSAS